ncbi:TrmH family RNA methyltransferase [Gordonia jinhuaensis]|nr:RNA methyltransferase [Gordonia jinhuaensis]
MSKLHRAAVRRRENRFLVEGRNSVTSTLDTGRALSVVVAEDQADRHADLLARAAGAGLDVLTVTARAAAKLSETDTTPGIFALSALVDTSLDDILAHSPRMLAVPVEMSDPGNAGTLIRAADAMGADAVVFAGESVDPHNGKSVRASAGSVFHLPIARTADVTATIAALRASGIVVLATAADGDSSLPDVTGVFEGPTAWLFGNEAHGLAPEIEAQADHRVSIPIRGRAESLNLASAASICLYENARAHRD